MEFFNLKDQYFQQREEIDHAIKGVLESGQFIMGPAIAELEKTLAIYVNTKYCIGVASGSDAVTLALNALDIGPGDEVISVPYTWVSPVECIKRTGARPVLIDIHPETYSMDANQLEKAITPQTKAIVAVSLYGQMPDYKKIMEIAGVYKIPVIEDAAQSFGAEQNGKKSCSVTTIGCTSFFPTKPFGCYGDGGAIFTNREDLAKKMQALRVHGAPERYNHQYIGQNARLDTLQAAILLAKFPYFEKELQKRREIAHFFNEHLDEIFNIPKISKGNTHTYALYVLRSHMRDEIVAHLKANGVPAGLYYPICIHLQPAYKDLGYSAGDFPVAEQIAQEIFSIPIHPFLTLKDQEKIVTTLNESILQKI